MDPVEFARTHSTLAAVVLGLCLWISLCLIARLWLVRSDAGFFGKLCWSFMLLIPFFRWLFYAAFFRVPSHHHMPLPPSSYT